MEVVSVLRMVLDELRSLSERFLKLEAATKPLPRPYSSPETNKLYEALSKAQFEIKLADKDSENPYHKSRYANLASYIVASRPALTKHGLAISHRQEFSEDGQTILVATLAHSSGQYVESRARIIPAKNDIQSMGSYITYLRRYTYVALCGLADIDDDGEAAVAESRDTFAKGTALNTKYNPKDESYQTLSKDQIAEMEYELAEYPDIAENILDAFKIQSIADIPQSKYRPAITRIREIKDARNNRPAKQS